MTMAVLISDVLAVYINDKSQTSKVYVRFIVFVCLFVCLI